jgi:hypothetical protein
VRLLLAVIGTAGLGAVFSVLVILARLTQKWEAVTRSRSLYRLFYVASGLVALAALVRLVRIGYLEASASVDASPLLAAIVDPHSWFYLYLYHIPLAVGMTISIWLIWKNWGWLLCEWDA